MNTEMKNIGTLLSERRKAKGLTQTEAGALIGVQKAMISKIENGACRNISVIERLVKALGAEISLKLQDLSKPDKKIIDYVMAAISEFSKRHSLSIREASNYLNRFKGIDFLSEFYDVEHTLSFNDCVDDLTTVCRNNGGALV